MGKLPVREPEMSQLVKSRIVTVFDESKDFLSGRVEGGGGGAIKVLPSDPLFLSLT